MHLFTLFLEQRGEESIFRSVVAVIYCWARLADNSLFTGSKAKRGKDVHLDVSRDNLLKLEALKQLNSLLSCLVIIEITVK